ncbi:ABC transporter permease [Parabacteroides pacaensis]|uniref:ABC transporter permease n=1 Tax=Parabacteroides pacaensis TaxID=2086575 RepID=UPI000D104A1C|nr:ABC transporter permease [Parabacteroides pacaensis]
MIRNYWTSAYKNLLKKKGFSFVNILGLAIGMTSALLILTYVAYEYSFDTMHAKGDRTYRVESTFYEGEVLTDYWATSSFGYAPAMVQDLSGIEDCARVATQYQPEQIVKYKDLLCRENYIAYAEPSFFRVFDYELKEGDRESCLATPDKVVISERIARKYFKNEEALGKILRFTTGSETMACEVSGVMKDMPHNVHVQYEFIISFSSLPKFLDTYWYKHECYTYVVLQPGVEPAQIENAFPGMAEKYKTEEALKNKIWGVRLLPLTDIHLTPQKAYEVESKGNRSAMLALIFAAIAILCIAWINYVNLTVARSMERAREVGLRRVVGATRKQLISQFLFESFVVNMLALIVAIGLVEAAFPAFNTLIGKDLNFGIWFHTWLGLVLTGIFLIGVFLSGYYPALILSAKKPIKMLKGKFSHTKGGERTRKVLVILQYTASLVLLCSTLVVFAQLRFMRNQALGVKTDQTLVIKFPGYTDNFQTKLRTMKKEIAKLPSVDKVSVSSAVPGDEVAMFLSNRRLDDQMKQNRLYEVLSCDEDYLEAYDLEIVAGRGFSEEYGADQNKLVVNETSVRTLGYSSNEEALGQLILVETVEEPMQIIGVVKDYHQQSLNKAYTPIMFAQSSILPWMKQRYISVVMKNGNPKELVNTVGTIWDKYFIDSSYDYFFLDQYFDQQYKQDEIFGLIMGLFTILAIFISCLGLWVLVMFSCGTRFREMGIRKVLGASNGNLFYQLGKEFFVLIGIAMLIALPLSWFTMQSWLSNYAFRTEMKGWFFLVPVVLLFFISLFTIGWQTAKTIYSKPARALRYE